ncbi:ComEA family DNA-binding protein [Ekhidna sp. To15]|uniref:ComEA family DNA-binding protein n=1 Tax=Ekhidna sp. To15 TaxID=3395267 RepID=UPI003F51C912
MLKYFTNAISSAIGFTKTESRGTLVLILIIFLAVIVMRTSISSLQNQRVITSDSSAIEWVNSVQASYDLKEVAEVKFDKSVYFPTRNKFKKSKNRNVKKASLEVKESKKISIKDLNVATGEELRIVRGIGPAYSERIIKYRDLLGGFSDTTQLTEVYGLNPEIVSAVLKQFQIKSEVIPIDINSDSIKVLARHPYISYDLARIIINYRKEHGDIQSAADLQKIMALDESTFLRLKPYLE